MGIIKRAIYTYEYALYKGNYDNMMIVVVIVGFYYILF